MIVFDLHCDHGHRFEGWFGSSSDYEDQAASGLVQCPECGSGEVSKAPMAPAVAPKGNSRAADVNGGSREIAAPDDEAAVQDVSNRPVPPEVARALAALAKAQSKALEKSTWVGRDFAERSREMHYGERDEAPIHGQASIEEAQALVDDGVPVAPLPFPVAPPDELN
ncbi:MAG: DUF1178 family protein [Erythrobacter sp.]